METSTTFFLLALISCIGFLLRLPYLDYPIDEDFAFYTYTGYFQKKGVRLIKDFWGAFPPVIFNIYNLAAKIFGSSVKQVRSFTNSYHLLNILTVYLAADYLLGKPEALTAAFIFAVFSATPYLGVYSCHAEGFYMLPVGLGVLALSHGAMENQEVWHVLCGVFIAAAFLLKIVNAVYFISFSVFLILSRLYMETLYFALAFTGALIVYTLAASIAYRGLNRQLWTQHLLRLRTCMDYVNANLKNNYKFDLVPIWKETSSIFFLSLLFLLSLFFVERNIPENILLVWAASTIIIIVFQRVYLMYHCLPVVQVASVLSALAFHRFIENYTYYPVFLSAPIALAFLIMLTLNLYRKVRFFLLYRKDKRLPCLQKADQFFYIPEIARYIRENTSLDDYIYVWGAFVQTYRLADRRSCDRFVFYFVKPYQPWHAALFEEIVNGIIQKKPAYIVPVRPDFDMEVLGRLSGLDYELERVFFNRYRVYRLKGKSAEPANIEKMSCEEKIKWLELLTPGSMDYSLDERYIKEGAYGKALNEYNLALKLNPNDILIKFGLASLMRTLERYEDAFGLYQEIAENGGKREWLHLEKAATFVKSGKYVDATKELDLEENLFPDKAETMHVRGTVFKGRKKYEDALDCFEKALEKDPTMEWVHLDTGLIYRDMGRFDDAAAEFQEEERLHPGKAETKHEQGVNYICQKKHEKAVRAFREALSINPSFSLSKYSLYSLLVDSGEYEEAKSGFLEILSDGSPVNLKGGSCFHLGKIHFKENNSGAAVDYFRKCLEYIPGHGEAHKYLKMI